MDMSARTISGWVGLWRIVLVVSFWGRGGGAVCVVALTASCLLRHLYQGKAGKTWPTCHETIVLVHHHASLLISIFTDADIQHP
jgi:hypothetical protein